MYLLDTNVVSEIRKVRTGRANAGVAAWSSEVDTAALFLSAVTIEEIEIGVLLAERRDNEQGRLLRNWFEGQVLPAFEGRILAVDQTVARRSALLQVPDPRPIRDALIAATAFTHDLTLVTRNTRDFTGTSVKLVNPWS
jgi:predicted nucleic acid-binding protein